VLVGVIPVTSSANRMAVSSDPSLLVTDLEAPSSTFSAEQFLLYLRAASSTTATATILQNLNIPLEGGTKLFVNFSTVGSVILLLENPV
jgi:hypothetical protein